MPVFVPYCRRLIKRVVDCLHSARDDGSVEGFHDMRVGIKRLRAVLNLGEQIIPHSDFSDIRKPIDRLFKSAGKVRDCHVGMDTIRQFRETGRKGLDEYYSALKVRERSKRERFADQASAFDGETFDALLDRLSEMTEGIDLSVVMTRSREQLRGRLMQLSTRSKTGSWADADLHRVRIDSKETRYIVEFIQSAADPDDDLKSLNKSLRWVHQTLGLWHDRDEALISLSKFLTKSAHTPLLDPKSYKAFSDELRRQRAASLDEFESAWESLMMGINRTGIQPTTRSE